MKIWPLFGLFHHMRIWPFLKLLKAKFGLFYFLGPGNPEALPLLLLKGKEYNQILYFNDNGHLRKMGFYMKRNEDRHTERQRVRERVSASVGQRRGKRRSTFTNNVGSNTFV